MSVDLNNAVDLIHPATPDTTDQQDREAAVRYYFEQFTGDYLYELIVAGEFLAKVENRLSLDVDEKLTVDRIIGWGKLAEAELEIEDIVQHSVDRVGSRVKKSLATEHGGDCTAFPATCPRCWAEGIYQIPYTANWTKHEGHSLRARYDALMKGADNG